jgi:hypothetical protein
MRGLMGSFSLLPLSDLLELLARRMVSGSLTCERGTVRKTLHLRDGASVGATSNDPREYLGQFLINFGHLTEEQLQKAFQVQEETRVRLGKVLTMVGLVSAEAVRECLSIKIRETILDAFLWDSGLFYVDDTPPEVVDELDARVSLADILREAEFRSTAWNAFRGEFPSGAATLAIDPARVPPGLGPLTVDGRLLALAAEGKTVDEIGLALHATDFHLYQRLYALARQGILRAAPVSTLVGEALQEAVEATELVEQAQALLDDDRAGDAEALAARAVDLAPASEAARTVLGEAERRLAARLAGELLEPPRVPRLKVATRDIAGLRLGSADKYLLSRCDGRRSVRQLAQVAPLRELETLKAVRRFVEDGLVELMPG